MLNRCNPTFLLFNMRILSITFTLLLLIPIVVCSHAIFQIFYQTTSDAIPKDVRFSIATPSIAYAASYLIFLILSILLNIKRKFTANIVLTGCLMLIYIFSINFISSTWLK
jgi:hypothetical protein